MTPHRLFPCLIAIALLAATLPAAEHSELWGADGEAWSADGRLPDFSFAGYRRGEQAIPRVAVSANVQDFGAVPDDDTDDTAAFQRVVAEAEPGAILVPAGRYIIRERIDITRSGIVLRGAGPDRTVLFCPRPLNEFDPKPTNNSGGRATTSYSWSDGFLRIRGRFVRETLASIRAPVARGAHRLPLTDTAGLEPGMTVEVFAHETEGGSLMRYCYAGDPGGMSDRRLRGVPITCRIIAVDDEGVSIDRPLGIELREAWRPELRSFAASVSESGIEGLRIEFPATPYGGHFSELGFNAFALGNVAHCWLRDVQIHNADSGVFLRTRFCSIDGLRISSSRRGKGGLTGHHGVSLHGHDNLLTDFDIQTRFVHDITVSGAHSACMGNVCERGRGVDLCFDHHRWTPLSNLFTEIDIGRGSRMYRSGGGRNRGRNCAAWETWWNIRAERALAPPKPGWSCGLINLIGLRSEQPAQRDADGLWFEPIAPEALHPANLYRAQRARRLKD